jgi:hypothetical protein
MDFRYPKLPSCLGRHPPGGTEGSLEEVLLAHGRSPLAGIRRAPGRAQRVVCSLNVH